MAIDVGIQAKQRDSLRFQHHKSLDTLAHEFKTPLTGLLASSRLMVEELRSGYPDVLRELAENIHRTAQTVNRRVSELLDLVATGVVGADCRVEFVDLRSVIRKANAEAWVFFLGRGQRLVVELPDSLPAVWGDPRRLRQVMVNLLTNASKFSPKGSVITVRAVSEGPEMRIEVCDCAPAIDPDERDLIFVPYYRGRNEPGASGSGLGLAICKELLERQKGRIWVEEGKGGGNVFCVSLPSEGGDTP